MDVYKSPVGQPKLKFENIPFEFTPDPNNRWVRLADLVPWEELELLSGYRNHFGSTGNPALPFRVAFGALLVQAGLRLTDEETVEQIRENPYIRYFPGFEGYRSEKKPFDPSMMVYFRKRLDAETLKALDLRIFGRRREAEERAKKEEEAASGIEPETAAPVVSKLGDGGLVLNLGSAVIMPEVFLKALSLARNLGHPVRNFTTVNMDMTQHYRPTVNVVQRPVLSGGRGYSLTGHHEIMIPLLAAAVCELSDEQGRGD